MRHRVALLYLLFCYCIVGVCFCGHSLLCLLCGYVLFVVVGRKINCSRHGNKLLNLESSCYYLWGFNWYLNSDISCASQQQLLLLWDGVDVSPSCGCGEAMVFDKDWAVVRSEEDARRWHSHWNKLFIVKSFMTLYKLTAVFHLPVWRA